MKTIRRVLLLAVFCGLLSLGPHASGSTLDVTVLLSLPSSLERQSRLYVEQMFDAGQFNLEVFSLEQMTAATEAHVLEDSFILAAGRASCEYASQYLQNHTVLCVLVSVEAFSRILDLRADTNSVRRFDAIVLDQPLQRQIKIASTVFPSLRKFGLLASGQRERYSATVDGSSLTVDQFQPNEAVAPQVANALSGQDALVAIPDRNVYTSDSLRTVLLTAYGYAKPVIGYSRSYVRAGALITTFTTPGQIYRQAVEILQNYAVQVTAGDGQVFNPRYFSITDNPSIAKSLGLVRRFRYLENYDYVDQDFSS